MDIEQRSSDISEEALPSVDALTFPPGLLGDRRKKRRGLKLGIPAYDDKNYELCRQRRRLYSSPTRHQIDDEHDQRDD